MPLLYYMALPTLYRWTIISRYLLTNHILSIFATLKDDDIKSLI